MTTLKNAMSADAVLPYKETKPATVPLNPMSLWFIPNSKLRGKIGSGTLIWTTLRAFGTNKKDAARYPGCL